MREFRLIWSQQMVSKVDMKLNKNLIGYFCTKPVLFFLNQLPYTQYKVSFKHYFQINLHELLYVEYLYSYFAQVFSLPAFFAGR